MHTAKPIHWFSLQYCKYWHAVLYTQSILYIIVAISPPYILVSYLLIALPSSRAYTRPIRWYSLQYCKYQRTVLYTIYTIVIILQPQFPPLSSTTQLQGIALDLYIGTIYNIINISVLYYIPKAYYIYNSCNITTLVPTSQQHYLALGHSTRPASQQYYLALEHSTRPIYWYNLQYCKYQRAILHT